MDLGVITAEAAAAGAKIYAGTPGVPAPVDFLVTFRFGMTIQAAAVIHQRLSLMLQASGVQIPGIPLAGIPVPSAPKKEGEKG